MQPVGTTGIKPVKYYKEYYFPGKGSSLNGIEPWSVDRQYSYAPNEQPDKKEREINLSELKQNVIDPHFLRATAVFSRLVVTQKTRDLRQSKAKL